MEFKPDGEFIDKIHKEWYGDFERIDASHDYIDWLFPCKHTTGANECAQPMRKQEAMAIY